MIRLRAEPTERERSGGLVEGLGLRNIRSALLFAVLIHLMCDTY